MVIFITCKKENAKNRSPLNGTWQMETYIAYAPVLPYIQANDIIWNFDLSRKQLKVTNKFGATYPFILQSDIYTINWTLTNVYINNVSYDYTTANDKLIISNNKYIDGPQMTFVK